MIEVKEAVQSASDYLSQLYPATQLYDVLLEEVWLSDDENYWFVTLGFSRPIPSLDPMRAMSESFFKTGKYQREYKIFQLDATTGQVRSMKIRAA